MKNKMKNKMFHGFYSGRRVLVTGCYGFKGSWLMCWLERLGAITMGYGHAPRTNPSHAQAMGLYMEPNDLLRQKSILKMVNSFRPEVIFHLAAHSIVIEGFKDPRSFVQNNMMAALNLFEAVKVGAPNATVICVTTDKVYAVRDGDGAYIESSPLGGGDPYSTSKVCVEQLAALYRDVFDLNIYIARAGNVIGGGDWNAYRLIPDLVRAAMKNEVTSIRDPNATRPWQHVLDALYGYLILGTGGRWLPHNVWNFGPEVDPKATVGVIAGWAQCEWPAIQYKFKPVEAHKGSIRTLLIDSARARECLGWRPPWGIKETVQRAVGWYRNYYLGGNILTTRDIIDYEKELGYVG
jgi:CDP-glucose 4,6-dehydratase